MTRTDVVERLRVLEYMVKSPRAKALLAEIRAEIQGLRAKLRELEHQTKENLS